MKILLKYCFTCEISTKSSTSLNRKIPKPFSNIVICKMQILAMFDTICLCNSLNAFQIISQHHLRIIYIFYLLKLPFSIRQEIEFKKTYEGTCSAMFCIYANCSQMVSIIQVNVSNDFHIGLNPNFSGRQSLSLSQRIVHNLRNV